MVAELAPTRLGIRMALGDMVVICAEAETAEDAIEATRRERPDVCIIGSEITSDAFGAVRRICAVSPNTVVVVLVEEPVVEELLGFVRAGAAGYVAGALDAERLARVVAAVAADEAVVPRSMVASLLEEVRTAGRGQSGLTAREAQVLRLLRRGHTTAEISAELGIVPVTVRRHVSQLVRKLGLENRAALDAGRDARARRKRPSRLGRARTDGAEQPFKTLTRVAR